ncbi:hypothetical protein HF521_019937 [Silurus meridionalis]|uniref:C-type lectin domain-containing protein n=1 Tax=Silurus meridionalis TaxID=175797 RepID=A0A8T0BKI9_SILME|nr:hypothetical protein HF521_019937 [Silurus meridionalis]
MYSWEKGRFLSPSQYKHHHLPQCFTSSKKRLLITLPAKPELWFFIIKWRFFLFFLPGQQQNLPGTQMHIMVGITGRDLAFTVTNISESRWTGLLLSEAEYRHVKSVIRAKDRSEGATWIGLSCCAKIRHWLWSDGTKVTYTKWNPTEPNYLPRECCAHMNWSVWKNWNDIPCDLQYPFVCVKKRV